MSCSPPGLIPELGAEVVTLCSGTRDPDNMRRAHPGNLTDDAWTDLRRTLDALLAAAGEAGCAWASSPNRATSSGTPTGPRSSWRPRPQRAHRYRPRRGQPAVARDGSAPVRDPRRGGRPPRHQRRQRPGQGRGRLRLLGRRRRHDGLPRRLPAVGSPASGPGGRRRYPGFCRVLTGGPSRRPAALVKLGQHRVQVPAGRAPGPAPPATGRAIPPRRAGSQAAAVPS